MTESQRQQMKEIAQAVIDGRVTMLEGLRALVPFAAANIQDDVDSRLIVGIDSETDHLPVGPVRKYWASDALERKDAEIANAEAKWGARFLDACRRIARSNSPLSHQDR